MATNNPLTFIIIAPLIGTLIGCPFVLGIEYLINTYWLKPEQAPQQVVVSTPAHEERIIDTNCPICTQDGEKCRFHCPFCKEGDHSFDRHIDRTKEFLCPTCCCYHKASKELIGQFRVLLKTREQQAALFPPAPSENNP